MVKLAIFTIFFLTSTSTSEDLAYLKMGIAKLKSGRYYEAIAYLDSAITLNPRLPKAYLFRGKAKSEIAKMELVNFDRTPKFNFYSEDAIKDFNKSLELDANDSQTYFERGQLRGFLYDKSGRLKDYNQAIKLNPKYK
ncbi:MAG: hypothetical protein ORN54_07440 [Cyclobacteriaceae bacterium]|nr:hypothetical protein [Cyclobacteriaceae bacterium]